MGSPFVSDTRYLFLLSCGICTHSNPSLFGTAVKHFDLFAINAELKHKKGDHTAGIIMEYNSYDHITLLSSWALLNIIIAMMMLRLW
jgi:hypothetical protein